MIRQVMAKEVLFAAASFAVDSTRMSVVDFTETIDVQPYTFMYRRPGHLTKYTLFIDPFTANVWLSIAAMVIAIGPIIWLVNRLSPYYEVHGVREDRGLFQMSSCVWLCYGAMLQQASFYFLCSRNICLKMIFTYWCEGVPPAALGRLQQNYCWLLLALCHRLCDHLLGQPGGLPHLPPGT